MYLLHIAIQILIQNLFLLDGRIDMGLNLHFLFRLLVETPFYQTLEYDCYMCLQYRPRPVYLSRFLVVKPFLHSPFHNSYRLNILPIRAIFLNTMIVFIRNIVIVIAIYCNFLGNENCSLPLPFVPQLLIN